MTSIASSSWTAWLLCLCCSLHAACSNFVTPTNDASDVTHADAAVLYTDAARDDADPGRRPGFIRVWRFFDFGDLETRTASSAAFFSRTPGEPQLIDDRIENCVTRTFLNGSARYVDPGVTSLVIDGRATSTFRRTDGGDLQQGQRVGDPGLRAVIGIRTAGSVEVPAFEVTSVVPSAVEFEWTDRGDTPDFTLPASTPLVVRWPASSADPDAVAMFQIEDNSRFRVYCSAPLSAGQLVVPVAVLRRFAALTGAVSYELGVWRRAVLRVGEHTIEFDMRHQHAYGPVVFR